MQNDGGDVRDSLLEVAYKAIRTYLETTNVLYEDRDYKLHANKIVDSLVVLDSHVPKQELTFDVITIPKEGIGKATSVKSKNVFLSLRRLISSISSGVLTAASLVEYPLLAPFVAIVLWDTFYANLKIDISEREAAVLLSLWKNRQVDYTVDEEGLLYDINSELESYNKKKIDETVLAESLTKLSQLGCIKLVNNNPKKWLLCEKVKIT